MGNVKITERDAALFEFINIHEVISLESAAILWKTEIKAARERLLKLKKSGHINYLTYKGSLTAISLTGLGYFSMFLEKKNVDIENFNLKALKHRLKVSEVASHFKAENIEYYIPNKYEGGQIVPDLAFANNTGIEVEITIKSKKAYSKKLGMLQDSDMPKLIYVCTFNPESLVSIFTEITEDDNGRVITDDTKERIMVISYDNLINFKIKN
jgi:hypothetical protein